MVAHKHLLREGEAQWAEMRRRLLGLAKRWVERCRHLSLELERRWNGESAGLESRLCSGTA